jgi:hypothetical protein
MCAQKWDASDGSLKLLDPDNPDQGEKTLIKADEDKMMRTRSV